MENSRLSSNGNYPLHKNRCADDSKVYVFVKIANSVYDAIEEFQSRKSTSGGGQPGVKIKFNGNSGSIHLPAALDSSGNIGGGGGNEFTFSVDDVEDSLECIQQTEQDLDVLGPLSYRMQIQANENVFERIHKKSVIAVEAEKRKCIREIKPNQADIGRKVKRLGGSSKLTKSSLKSSLHSGILGGNSNIVNKSATAQSKSQSTTTVSARAKLSMGIGALNALNTFSGESSGGPLGSGGGNKSSGSSGGCKIPNISRRNLRERLIHLLALKPFKKPVLYSRLQYEGILTHERAQIMSTLKDIATLSSDNTYNLRRPMWKYVNESWPYYSEEEQQQLKRDKLQNLTPPLRSDAGSSTSGQIPTKRLIGTQPPLEGNGGSCLKRSGSSMGVIDDSGMKAKKQRISHFKKEASSARTASGGKGVVSCSNTMCGDYSSNGNSVGAGLHHSIYQQKQQTATGLSSSSSSSSIDSVSTSRAPTTLPAIQVQHAQINYLLQHQQHSNDYQQQMLEKQEQHERPMMQQIADEASTYIMAHSFSQTQKCDLSNYTRITTIEQRRDYKSEFESDYEEYRVLHDQIGGVSLRFRELAEKLTKVQQGGADYHNIQQQIVSGNQKALQRAKSRLDYLHQKLAHIKQLITDYDESLTYLPQS